MPDLTNPPASNIQSGHVTITTQAFSGDKSFQGGLTASAEIMLDGIISTTDTTKQNNWNPTGLASTYEIRWIGTASIGITGLSGGVDGRDILITNATTDYLLWLENQNTSSTAANRFILPNSQPAFLMPNDSILLRYDTIVSRWRVKNWPNKGYAMGLTHFEDFMGLTAASTPVSGYISSVSGTGASVQMSQYLENTTEKPVGVIQCDTGTTAAGLAGLQTSSAQPLIATTGSILTVSRLAIEAVVTGTETYTVATGLADNVGTITNAIIWEYRWNGSAAEWAQTRYTGTTPTRTTTGSPSVSTNYIWLVIFVNPGWTRVDYIYSDDSISFTLASSPTTGIPGSGTQNRFSPVKIFKSAGTTQRNVSLDCYGWRLDIQRG